MAEHGLSERQACKLLELDRTTYRYEPRPDRNAALRAALMELARQKPHCGYRRLGVLLARCGWAANPKRVCRLYRQEHLTVRRFKRKRVQRIAPPAAMLTAPNQEWAIDFVMDSLAAGRSLRPLTIVDSFTRECPAIEADSCLGSRRVTRLLDRVTAERGKPLAIRCDNGPEFTSRHFLSWCEKRQIRLVFIEPGRPVQNGHIESFNGRFRDECLNANWFLTLADAKTKIEARRRKHSAQRPHSSLGYLAPEEFAARRFYRADVGPRGFKRNPLAPHPDARCPRGHHDEARCQRVLKLRLVEKSAAGQ